MSRAGKFAEVRARFADVARSYEDARAEAQREANASGMDYGVHQEELFGDFAVLALPRREHRRGPERRCEVVSCEDIDRCAPGHGPELPL